MEDALPDLWIERPAWMDRAACQGEPTRTFFPGHGESTASAKALCADCPVRGACLDWALETEQEAGVWGGKSAKERRSMARPDPRCADCELPFTPAEAGQEACRHCLAERRRGIALRRERRRAGAA